MAKTPEGKVKDAVRKVLRQYGVYHYMPMQNGMGVVGIPDIICCVRGKFLAIETKAPGKLHTVTANQQRQIDLIRESGGVVLVTDNALDVVALLVNMLGGSGD